MQCHYNIIIMVNVQDLNRLYTVFFDSLVIENRLGCRAGVWDYMYVLGKVTDCSSTVLLMRTDYGARSGIWDYILGKVCRNPEQVSINSYVQDVYKESGGALVRVLTRTVEFITVVITVFKTVTFATIKSTLSIITLEII